MWAHTWRNQVGIEYMEILQEPGHFWFCYKVLMSLLCSLPFFPLNLFTQNIFITLNAITFYSLLSVWWVVLEYVVDIQVLRGEILDWNNFKKQKRNIFLTENSVIQPSAPNSPVSFQVLWASLLIKSQNQNQ